ncbi:MULTISPECIES: hypothetical protein [Streptomyces]
MATTTPRTRTRRIVLALLRDLTLAAASGGAGALITWLLQH